MHYLSPQFMRGRDSGTRACHSSLMTTFSGPHCGALYEVNYTKVIVRDRDTADCDVCKKQMDSWSSSRIPSYRLVGRSKDPD
jgi:hypothetical protein